MPRARIIILTLVVFLALAAIAVFGPSQGQPSYSFDPAAPLHDQFSAQNAYQHIETQVGFGPRPAGTTPLEKTRVYLEEQLSGLGWTTQRQSFSDDTPIGSIQFANIRARFGSEPEVWDQRVTILLGSHIDTKLFRELRFVGANDAGSSTGVLLEIARVAATRPEFARHLELIFFDGEEAFEAYTEVDGLYGSRHYAREIIRRQPVKQRPKAFVLLDMVGEKDLTIGLPSDTPKELSGQLFAAASDLGYREYFSIWRNQVIDDHVPFQNEGMDVINLIDMDFDAWHTSRDTLDVISVESLKISGQVTLLFLEKYLLAE